MLLGNQVVIVQVIITIRQQAFLIQKVQQQLIMIGVKNKCLKCGAKADSEYCFKHKPKKQLQKNEKTLQMQEMFLSIWKKKKHYCENCNVYLGNEAKSYMFDHLLEKSKYSELTLEEDNIMITCLNCHATKTNGHYSEYVKERIKKVKEMFNIK